MKPERMFDDERRHPWVYGIAYAITFAATALATYAKHRGWL